MEESGKRRMAAGGAIFAGLAYFLICALPLPKELVLEPVWTRSLAAAPHAPAASPRGEAPVFPFRLGDRYGYYTAQGDILFAATVSYGVALAPDAYAPFERLSESFTVRSPSGAELATTNAPGYPFFASGRRFLLGPDQVLVSELGPNGAPIWSYEFPSVITAFASSPGLAVFGLMDGGIVGLDRRGKETLRFSPGGSRIAGLYGLAVSPDDQLVAAVSGLDKQRLVVLEKRSSAYRVTYHRWLDSDYRRPVAMAFTPDGRRLVYETPGGAGVYDRATRSEFGVAAPALSGVGLALVDRDLLVLLAGGGVEKRLICAAPTGRRVLDVGLNATESYIDIDRSSIFVGADGDLFRVDLREE